MEYLLDTANLFEIETYQSYFPIAGVTSNPSIVKKEGKIDFFSHMKQIRSIIGMDKSLHIQVTASDALGMLKDAQAILEQVDDKVYIKVPVTLEGIKVIKKLKEEHINVTATAIYTKQQGFLAMEAGADYIAPYYNRMENSGIDPKETIASFAAIIRQYNYATKILAASFKNAGQIDQAFIAGAQSATMAPQILCEALQLPAITKAVNDFEKDWMETFGQHFLYQL